MSTTDNEGDSAETSFIRSAAHSSQYEVSAATSSDNFFSSSHPDAPPPPAHRTSDGGGGGDEEEEDDKLLVSDIFNSNKWNIVEYQRAICRPLKQQIDEESALYFIPTSNKVSMELKVGAGNLARRPYEEGLYVGETASAYIKEGNRNRMEERFIRSNDVHWFADDGQIKSVADVVDSRPPRTTLQFHSQALHCEYHPASSVAVFGGQQKYFELQVEIKHLNFTHHHLFSREHVIASQLVQLMQQYNQRALNNVTKQVEKKLELLRGCVCVGGGSRVDMYRREVVRVRQRLWEEEGVDRALLKAILKTWKELKTLRQTQGFTCTNCQLKISKRESDASEDERKWNYAVEQEVKELKAEAAEGGKAFDEDESRRQIESKAFECRRHPGEPFVYPHLNESAEITKLELCPRDEQRRRSDVEKCEILVRVFYNDKQLTQTLIKRLGQDFNVHFGQTFHLRVCNAPKQIAFKLYEKLSAAQGLGGGGGGGQQLVAQVYVSPSEQHEHTVWTEGGQQFSNERAFKWKHAAVGSGGVSSNESTLFTSGRLFVDVRWTDAAFPPPPPPSLRTGGGRAVVGGWDRGNMRQWVEEAHLDPNDPDNALTFLYLQDGAYDVSEKSYFRLDQTLNFVEDDRFFNCNRFRLIRLRDKQTPEFRHLRMVPLNEREVSAQIFQAYERRLVEERELRLDGADDDEEEDVDVQRRKVLRYINKVREEVWWRYQLADKKKKLLNDVVTEEEVPNIGVLGESIVRGLTEARRPLRPLRKDRRKVTYSHNVIGNNVTLIVNVASAFNVPLRQENTKTNRLGNYSRQATSQSLSAPAVIESSVRPVVEISFQQRTVSTGSSCGPNPCWNQDLQLPFRAPNDDLSAANIQQVADNIYFNLFDEVSIDMLEDERKRESHVHQRIEKRWLGSFQIPFATLYLNGRVEGTFRMESPSVLIGYSRAEDVDENIYLSLFLTLEPTLPLPQPLKASDVKSRETEKIIERVEQMTTEFSDAFPRRHCRMLVIDVEGKSVAMTRFLRPIAPPEALKTELAVARFVSLIPLLSEVVIFPGHYDIWTTSDKFLEFLVGDHNEHAVLLANYLSHFNKQVWLLIGFVIPEGRCVYVLSAEDAGRTFYVWNPCSGERFNVKDSFCPVQSIDCLLNSDNIWLNIQRSSQPVNMHFDLANSRHWRPLFDHSFPNPGLTSLQPESLIYKATEKEFVEKLEKKIEDHLKSELMKWRKQLRTSWNRHCSQTLYNILKRMEKQRYVDVSDEIGDGSSDEGDLQTILNAYKMNGFPLTMAYTDLNSVSDVVYAKGVHLAEGENVEFALAVYLYPYANNVVAVWIYLATLQKR